MEDVSREGQPGATGAQQAVAAAPRMDSSRPGEGMESAIPANLFSVWLTRPRDFSDQRRLIAWFALSFVLDPPLS